MKNLIILIFCFLIFNCKNKEEIKKDCLPSTLIKKLDDFKYELADSLDIEPKQFNLVNKLIEQAAKKKRIAISNTEFDSIEIVSLVNCFSNFANVISDSSYIWMQSNESDFKFTGYFSLINKPKEQEYLVLFWLYHLIDKTFISDYIEVLDNETLILNGDTLTNYSEISKRIAERREKLSITQIERATISIKANKDNVDMDAIEKIENELREINILRINYSTHNTEIVKPAF